MGHSSKWSCFWAWEILDPCIQFVAHKLLWFLNKAMDTTSLLIHYNHTIFGWLIHLPKSKNTTVHLLVVPTHCILIMCDTMTECNMLQRANNKQNSITEWHSSKWSVLHVICKPANQTIVGGLLLQKINHYPSFFLQGWREMTLFT